MNKPTQQLLAILFVQPSGISLSKLTKLTHSNSSDINKSIEELREYLTDSGLDLLESSGLVQIVAKSKLLPKDLIEDKNTDSLSPTALEVLAIVAYKQPITRAEIEDLRGIGSEQSLRGLLEKELIIGQKSTKSSITHIHYVTTAQFLRHIGITSLDKLPDIKEK